MNLCASPASPSWYPATPRNRSPCPLSPLPQDDEPLLLLYSPLFLGLSLCLCASVVNSCFPNSEEFCVNSANLPSLPQPGVACAAHRKAGAIGEDREPAFLAVRFDTRD